MNRRRFYIFLTYAVWAVMGITMAVSGLLYLLFPPKPRREDDWVDATDLASLQQGVPENVIFAHSRVDGWKVTVERTSAWIVRRPDGMVKAFAPQCTHLGCAYHWDAKGNSFLCPCHSSRFAIDGQVLGGPATRPLDQFTVKIADGKVQVGRLKVSV